MRSSYGSVGFNVVAALAKSVFFILRFVMPLAGDPDLAGAAAVGDDAGPPRSQPRQHRALQAWGIPHFVADALKMIFKEDFVPPKANKFLFALAPMLAVAPVLIAAPSFPSARPCAGAS